MIFYSFLTSWFLMSWQLQCTFSYYFFSVIFSYSCISVIYALWILLIKYYDVYVFMTAMNILDWILYYYKVNLFVSLNGLHKLKFDINITVWNLLVFVWQVSFQYFHVYFFCFIHISYNKKMNSCLFCFSSICVCICEYLWLSFN